MYVWRLGLESHSDIMPAISETALQTQQSRQLLPCPYLFTSNQLSTQNMSERGRSRSPKSLTRSPAPRSPRTNGKSQGNGSSGDKAEGVAHVSTSDDVEMKAADGEEEKQAEEADTGFKVVVVSGLTKNVHKGHLEEVFGEYGKITGLDLPLFKVCKCTFVLIGDIASETV